MTPENKPSPEVIAEFKRLYNAARLQGFKGPTYETALAWADQHSFAAGKILLQAAGPAFDTRSEEALVLLEQAPDPSSVGLAGYFEHAKGFRLDQLNRLDEAAAAYQKALAATDYETPAATLLNLALIYGAKGELDRAKEYYRRVLDAPGRWRGSALNGLGVTAIQQNDFDRAIDYLQEAIAEPDYDMPQDSLYNLGLAFHYKADLPTAIKWYEEAFRRDTAEGSALKLKVLNALALALNEIGRPDEALETVEKALALPDEEHQHERSKNIRTQLLAAMAQIQPSQEEQALVSATVTSGGNVDTPEGRMKQKLLGKDDKYSEYIRKENSKRDNTFSVLRGWSSAVTLLEGGSGKQWRGGGYFLKWKGRGLVLDPGFDFIDNFHDAGFHAREIDAVVVSHNHPDHNFDLGSLDDLRFEIFRRELKQLPDKTSAPALPPTLFAIDEDTAAVFKDDSPKHRGKPFRFTGADYERKRWLNRENGLPLRIEHFPVQHGKDVPNARGIRLVLYDPAHGEEFVIGYTGDTFYFAADPETGDPGLVKQLQGCDILLAHISQPMTQELDDPNFPKPVHLGYNGVAKLVQEVKPKITLIGEFWAGLADLRLDLIQGLRRRCGVDSILPTGLGFHLSLPSLEVECTRCRLPVPFAQIKVAPPTIPFGPLGYLCPRCLV